LTDTTTGLESADVDALRAELEKLRAEVEGLRSERDAAELRSTAKTDFISHISHELRTPMNGILGMTRLALETELNHEQREYLEVVQSSADALLTLVNDLLDHAKIDAGRLELESIPFRLNDTVRDTLRGVAVLADHKGLTLDYEPEGELPDNVLGDPTRLRQVLLNLVGNAIKFTEKGRIVVTTHEVERTEETAHVRFAITDTGIGIPPDRVEAIFGAFEQADMSTTRRFGGTGLGLSISSQLVRMMDGKIEVESEVGTGSTFHFTIPFDLKVPQSPLTGEGFADLAGGLAVLVVSDGTANQDLLVEVLADGNMHPRIAEDTEQALQAIARVRAKGEAFGLVILDLQNHGLETAFELRRDCMGTPMILMTPSGQRGDAARCRELGIGGYLTGPVVASDLSDTIQAVLAGTPELITRYWLKEHRRSLSILVADDSSTNRLLAARLLEKRGHHVVGVPDGAQAVSALEQRDFDVVLMDVHMPVMDGYEAARQIRSLPGHRSQTPIVALTGSVNEDGKRRCLEAGMNRFVGKPFRVEELLEIINEMTGS
jgi:CheY-like chemotaxis protein/nitrogen-specific signal transduction histidine kinase